MPFICCTQVRQITGVAMQAQCQRQLMLLQGTDPAHLSQYTAYTFADTALLMGRDSKLLMASPGAAFSMNTDRKYTLAYAPAGHAQETEAGLHQGFCWCSTTQGTEQCATSNATRPGVGQQQAATCVW